jgi:hypothetical protein
VLHLYIVITTGENFTTGSVESVDWCSKESKLPNEILSTDFASFIFARGLLLRLLGMIAQI